jgi:phosphate transport system protein
MSQLREYVNALLLRLDRMGLRVRQSVADAVRAAWAGDAAAGKAIEARDDQIDTEEVAIEQEAINLLALFQPTAIDLRTIFTIIKVNNDLERIADKAATIGRRVKYVVLERIDLNRFGQLAVLRDATLACLDHTVQLISFADITSARDVLAAEDRIDQVYADFVSPLLEEGGRPVSPEVLNITLTLIRLARALERIGDLCSNIAEDVVFLRTGSIIRHAAAQEALASDHGRP